jgi:hypothetical protein
MFASLFMMFACLCAAFRVDFMTATHLDETLAAAT